MELVGRQFGHIRVTGVIGEGGMGAVYAGYDEKLDRKVAVKVLHTDHRLDEEARERLLREARALSRVDHPNICRIYDYIETGEVDLLVLEYIDGRTLDLALADGLGHNEKLRIAATIAEVLLRAHRVGIIHRDLKPDNVMLTSNGEVKVLDFGLARWLRDSRRTAARNLAVVIPAAALADTDSQDTQKLELPQPWITPGGRSPRPELATAFGVTLGTPFYMSPEQARGETLTPASDMFAFGLLLQILFSGTQPHPDHLPSRDVIVRAARGETLPATGAPKTILPLINDLKSFAPADRPTAADALERLRHVISRPQRIVRRSLIATAVVVIALGTWRYVVDLKAERAEALRQQARAEDLINFMVGDLRKKLETVGRLDILDGVAAKALQYASSTRPETMSAAELARNAKVLNQLGEVRMGQGNVPGARELFHRALALAELAVQKSPADPQMLFAKSQARYWIGNSLFVDGDVAGALVHMQEYQRDSERLAAMDPANRDYQRERAYGHGNVATMLENLGRIREALPHHRANLEIKQRLHDGSDASNAELAVGNNKVGVALYRVGELGPSIDYLRREHDIYRSLIERHPKDMRYKQKLATNMAYLARGLTVIGRKDEAAPLYRAELEIESELAERDPTNVTLRRSVAMTSRNVAEGMARAGDLAGAERLIQSAQAKIAEAIRLAPTRTSFGVDAATIDVEYGRLLGEHGQNGRALALIRGAIPRLEKLEARAIVARAYFYEGEILRSSRAGLADAAYRRAEEALAPAMAKSTEPGELSLWTRILIRRERMAEARAMLTRIRRTGQSTTDIEKLCDPSGC